MGKVATNKEEKWGILKAPNQESTCEAMYWVCEATADKPPVWQWLRSSSALLEPRNWEVGTQS